ncbi:conserved exported hypothetical protein [Candidatus Sulfopaludibacter sp. SbA3]|nr:conserved exported hypothetical protein [Candidatus Sulfopaludibacter sp. SbA3]
MMRRLALIACLLIVLVAASRLLRPQDPLPTLPRLMLWAWESPQDLRFVKPGSAGIAFLARTVWLTPERAVSRPRLQPLRFTPGTDLMAVVRFESAGHGLPREADALREVMPAAQLPGVRALQIDFDARRSERAWYARFLRELRRAAPASLPIAITALESWCDGDRWMRGLPVADATPMLFLMGPGERIPSDFKEGLCRFSIGVSTNELPARVPRGRRLYFFHSGPWTQQAYDVAVAQAGRWWR